MERCRLMDSRSMLFSEQQFYYEILPFETMVCFQVKHIFDFKTVYKRRITSTAWFLTSFLCLDSTDQTCQTVGIASLSAAQSHRFDNSLKQQPSAIATDLLSAVAPGLPPAPVLDERQLLIHWGTFEFLSVFLRRDAGPKALKRSCCSRMAFLNDTIDGSCGSFVILRLSLLLYEHTCTLACTLAFL